MSTATPEYVIPAPELRGAVLQLAQCHDEEVGIDGPAGCVAGETRIYNPVTGAHTPIKELYEKKIAPTVQTLIGAVQAEVPFRKGVADLYQVTLASGRKCIVTQNHRVLTPKGWRFVSALSVGDLVGVSEPNAQLSYAHNSTHTDVNSLSCCLSGPRQCDVQLPLDRDNDLYALPSQDDALLRIPSDLHRDDRAYGRKYTHLAYIPRASKGCSHQFAHREYAQTYGDRENVAHVDVFHQRAAQSQRQRRLDLPIHEQGQYCHSMGLNANRLTQYPQHVGHNEPASTRNREYPQFDGYSMFVDTSQGRSNVALLTDVCNPSTVPPVFHNNNSVYYSNTLWGTVSSIEYVRTDEYFDLHVPFAEHYLAEGIWHHNTGKTFGILYYIHILLLKYAGAKWLVTRRYNTDLAGSAMATYQNEVLDPREGVHYFGGNKVKPPGFMYPNGSFMAVNGLDRPSRLKSFDADGIYINEATECEIDHIEFSRMRLRKGVMPWQQLLMDFNPDAPTHFLNERMNAGITTRLLSRHEDNPRYFNAITQDWTEEGRRYIFGILGGLTGVRYARYRLGLWAAAEGTVYQDSWDRARNIIDRYTIPRAWPRYLAVDFGYTNPFCCLWCAVDPDGRLIIYRQLYKTKTLIEEHARQIAISSGWFHLLPTDHPRYQKRPAEWADPLPRDIICDHDAQGRAVLEAHLKLYTTPAKKTILDGIQAVTSRLRPAGDGIPRLQLMRDCLIERDQELVKMKLPTCLEEEAEVYVWDTRQGRKTGEEPVDANNHAWDTARYLVAYSDLTAHSVSYFKNIWQ